MTDSLQDLIPPEYRDGQLNPGDIVLHRDGDVQHLGILIYGKTRKRPERHVALVFTSSRSWTYGGQKMPVHRKATTEEMAWANFVSSKPTFLAWCSRPSAYFELVERNVVPANVIQALRAEFQKMHQKRARYAARLAENPNAITIDHPVAADGTLQLTEGLTVTQNHDVHITVKPPAGPGPLASLSTDNHRNRL